MLREGGGVCSRQEGVKTTGSGRVILGLPTAAGALTVLSFLGCTDRLFWWERREGFVLGARTAPAVFSPDGLVPLGLESSHPLAGRRKLAGADGFGRTSSAVLFSGRPQWQGTGSGGGARAARARVVQEVS